MLVDRLYEVEVSDVQRKTLGKYQTVFRAFDAWMAERHYAAEALTATQAQEFIAWAHRNQRWHPTTIQQRCTMLKSAWLSAQDRGMQVGNPWRRCKLPRVPQPVPRTYTNDELRDLLATVRTAREDVFLKLQIFNGLRGIEVRRAERDKVDLKAGEMWVDGKGHRLRKIPLHPEVARALHRLFQERPQDRWVLHGARSSAGQLGDTWAQTTGRALCDRAGVPYRGLHAFRRTLASTLDEEGVAASLIEALLGWSSTSVRLRHYTRVLDVRLHDAILAAYKSDPLIVR